MATYKVVDAEQLNADMTSVADSIRTKGGTTDALAWPDGYKTAIEAIQTGGSAPSLQSKSVTYTSNGTNTITPDAGYDGLSSVGVTVNVASGGGGGAGFKVTFPATATNWDMVDQNYASIFLADGTTKSVKDYSTIGGKTIENVTGINIYSVTPPYVLIMTLSEGAIAQFQTNVGKSSYVITTDHNMTASAFNAGRSIFWWPIADTVISAIEMYNTE